MTARPLLRLYPSAWRARYEDEVLGMCGDRSLTFQQMVDLLAGAVDARLSAPVPPRGAQMATSDSTVGFLRRACVSSGPAYTTRDGLIGAGAIVAGSFLFLAIGIFMNANGWHDAGKLFKSIGFPVSLLLSSNFTFMKGLPRRVRVVVIGGTITVIVGASLFATLVL